MRMRASRGGTAVLMLSLGMGAWAADETRSESEVDFGLKISGTATASDVGLPNYPGATPYKEGDQSSSGANLGLSTSAFGFKVVGLNLVTRDTPDKVGVFYEDALAKYGSVLKCTGDAGTRSTKRNKDSEELVCEADDPGSHSVVYKVGTENNQRIVAIKPHGRGTRFSLVHVDTRGKSRK